MEVCSVLRRVYVMRIYSSIAKDLKFDWSIQVTWKQRAYSLVQQHESWQIFQLLSFLSPVGAGGLLEQIIVLFWVIMYSYLQKVLKIEHYFYRPSWNSCFCTFEHICNITSVLVKLASSLRPFETLKNIEMHTRENKITWTWEFILFQLLSKFNFWRKDWALGCVSIQIWHFPKIS